VATHVLHHTRTANRVTIMRSTFSAAAAAALLLLSLAPLAPAAGQAANRDSVRAAERARARQERDRERAEREAERARERADRDDDDDDEDKDDDVRGPRTQGRSAIDTTVAFSRGGVVDLSLVSGDIRVVGWARNEVKVSARAENGDLRFEATQSRVTLDLEHGGYRGRHHDNEARYELSVPEGTRVLMRSTSGDISARGVKGEIEARSISGGVDVEDARRVTLESVSGDVNASRVAADARAHSVSGEVKVRDVGGDVDVESVSGDIELRGARSRVTRAETVSGDVTYEGSVDPAGRYDFTSHSGTLRLVLPASTNASLSVETFSGEIDSAFRLQMRPAEAGRSRPRRMEFTLGSGGPRITAQTFSGEIVLERAGTTR